MSTLDELMEHLRLLERTCQVEVFHVSNAFDARIVMRGAGVEVQEDSRKTYQCLHDMGCAGSEEVMWQYCLRRIADQLDYEYAP